jgi:hypothetical protein
MSYPHQSPQSFASPSGKFSQADFIRDDVDALASHMQHCARAQGRWSGAKGHLQWMRALAAGRIVTFACVVIVLGIGLAVVV